MPPTISEISARRSRSRVATPKLLSPPRIAQNSSGSESSLAGTVWPSAVTTSAASRLSIVSPVLRSQEPDPARQRDPADADRAGVAKSGHASPLTGGKRVLACRRAGS